MLNADSYGGSSGELLSHNVFAYSLNNPVNYVDPSGNIPIPLLIWGGLAIIDTGYSIYSSYQSDGPEGAAKTAAQEALYNAMPGGKVAKHVRKIIPKGTGNGANNAFKYELLKKDLK